MTEPAPIYRATGAGKSPRTCGTCRFCEPSRITISGTEATFADYVCAWLPGNVPDPYPEWLNDEPDEVDADAPTDCPAWTPRR